MKLPRSTTALIIRSDYEEATFILSAYMQIIVDRARQLGFDVIDLHAGNATKQNFFNSIEIDDPLLIVAAGHGNETTFTGQNDEHILEACENDEVMSGREGIFNSCSVGVMLGPSMVEKKALWFAGYRADFLFMYNPEEPNPLEDKYARPFMECIIEPALTRLESRRTDLIYTNTRAIYNHWIGEWWNSDDPLAQDVITLLIHDRDNFMVTGVYVPPLANTLPLLIGGLVVSHYLFKFP